MIVSWISGCIGALILLYAESFNGIIFGLIFIQSYSEGFFGVSYVFLNEIMGKHYRNFTSSIGFFCYGVGNFIFLFMNLYMNDYKDVTKVIAIANITSLVFVLAFTETPFFYYKKKNLKDFTDCLFKIAKTNKVPEVQDKIENQICNSLMIKPEELRGDSVYKIKKFKHKKLPGFKVFMKRFSSQDIKNLFFISFVTLSTYFPSGIFINGQESLGLDNKNINIVLSNVGEMLGYLFMSKYSVQLPRKKLMVVYYAISVIVSLIFISFTIFGIRGYFLIKLTESLLSMFLRFWICAGYSAVYVFINELFPSSIRGFALGLNIYLGRLSMSLAISIILLADSLNIHPLFFMGIQGVICYFCLQMLPETLNKKLKN